MALTTTAKLIPYRPNSYPTIGDGVARYSNDELGRISNTLDQIITAMKALEARIVLGGL